MLNKKIGENARGILWRWAVVLRIGAWSCLKGEASYSPGLACLIRLFLFWGIFDQACLWIGRARAFAERQLGVDRKNQGLCFRRAFECPSMEHCTPSRWLEFFFCAINNKQREVRFRGTHFQVKARGIADVLYEPMANYQSRLILFVEQYWRQHVPARVQCDSNAIVCRSSPGKRR